MLLGSLVREIILSFFDFFGFHCIDEGAKILVCRFVVIDGMKVQEPAVVK